MRAISDVWALTALTLLFSVLIAPMSAQAQSSRISYWNSRESVSTSTSEYIYQSRDNRALQNQLNSLSTTAESNLPIPILLGVSVTNLTRNFGDPRDGGARTHEGLDIMAPQDTPIVSPIKRW